MTFSLEGILGVNQTVGVFAPAGSWALSMIGAFALHERGLTGAGVRIGHVDSGVGADERDLRARTEQFRLVDLTGNLITSCDPRDATGHGTRTASVIVGKSRARMLLGAAPGAFLLSASVIEGGASIVRVLRGLDWLAEERVPIVLVCLGLSTPNPVLGPMLATLRQGGALVVCPVGNSGRGHASQPGDDPSVLSVGAVDRAGQVARFSGSRSGRLSYDVRAPDVLAPGVEVPAARLGGARGTSSGTSMAAALVAASAALLREAVPDASADELFAAICLGAREPSTEARKDVRCGYLDVPASLRWLLDHREQATPPRPERGPREDAGWRDARLRHQVKQAAPETLLTGVYIVRPDADEARWPADVAGVVGRVKNSPGVERLELLVRGRALLVTATPAVHAALLEDRDVHYASAADTGRALDSWWGPTLAPDEPDRESSDRCPQPLGFDRPKP